MSRMSEVRNDIYERDMRDVEGIGEPATELAQLHQLLMASLVTKNLPPLRSL